MGEPQLLSTHECAAKLRATITLHPDVLSRMAEGHSPACLPPPISIYSVTHELGDVGATISKRAACCCLEFGVQYDPPIHYVRVDSFHVPTCLLDAIGWPS
jgi:hypothetical protein